MSVNFWIFLLYYLISLNFWRILSKNDANPFPVRYKLMSVTVLNLTNGFVVLRLWVLTFFLIFRIIAHFLSSFSFLVNLSHQLQAQLMESIFGKMGNVEKRRIWIFLMFCWVVYALWLRHSSLTKFVDFFLVFTHVFFFLFVVVRHILDNDRSFLLFTLTL